MPKKKRKRLTIAERARRVRSRRVIDTLIMFPRTAWKGDGTLTHVDTNGEEYAGERYAVTNKQLAQEKFDKFLLEAIPNGPQN